MAELRAQLEELEQRLEKAEEALRNGPPWALQLPAVPVTFEDIAVHFSRQEWASLDEGQRQLYHTVMEDNYATLVSLYCALSKPQLIARMERGEEPCVPENPDPGGADLSLQLAAEPEPPSCTSDDGIPGMKMKESSEGSCQDPEEGPVATENCSERHVPPSATAVPADPSQPTPSPSCPLSTCSWEAVNLNQSVSPPPAAAADAKVGVPLEVPPEVVAAEDTAVPEMPLEPPEEEEKEEDVKSSGSTVQALGNIPKELGAEQAPGVRRAASPEGPCPGIPGERVGGSCAGRTAACQRSSTREKVYSCLVCRRSFLLKINLLIHQRSHSRFEPYVCPHCNGSFVSQREMQRHLRARAARGCCLSAGEERRTGAGRCPLSAGKVYTCNQCPENFSSQSFLILHQRQHSRHHLILCPCCNRTFIWASDFLRHHRTHTGERPYQCGVCQKTFKRTYHLTVHQRRIHVRKDRRCPRRKQRPVAAQRL